MPIQDKTTYDRVLNDLNWLEAPAREDFTARRVTTLLLHYFVASMPANFHEAVADDWLDELEGYPDWAITAACKWWVGSENKNKHRKPVPGDISAICKKEVGPISIARFALTRFDRGELLPFEGA